MPIPIGTEAASAIQRADIEVAGLEHAGQSYELRVFLNNPDADADTEPTPDNGYAASIYVYGYGAPPAPPDMPTSLPLSRSVMATDAVRRAAARGDRASVTLVPVATAGDALDLASADVSVLVNGNAADVTW